MEILHLLTGDPVLFFDFRHYDAENDVFVFSNCGSQSTFYTSLPFIDVLGLGQIFVPCFNACFK
jgi:L-fucose isomerase-like protein